MTRIRPFAVTLLISGLLVAGGCGDDDDATPPPADTTSGEDTAEPADVQTNPDGGDTCLECDCFLEGGPCPPEDLDLICMMEGHGPWCGQDSMNFSGGCQCVGGTWTCDMSPPPLCHDCCQEAEGEMYFCGADGNCIAASGCEADSCCVPGTKGDTYCQAAFGDASSCVPGDADGACDPM